MRCKNCKFTEYDIQENCEVCGIFGFDDDGEISENAKGEVGCKYTRSKLEKIYAIHTRLTNN